MREERGVSTPLNYVLLLGVAALLAGVLLAGTTGYVEDEQRRALQSEMEVVGQRIAGDLAAADRLAAADGVESAAVDVTLPDRLAGRTYLVEIRHVEGDRYRVTVRTAEPNLSVTVRVDVETPVQTGRVAGGDLRVVYDPATDRLEVRGDG